MLGMRYNLRLASRALMASVLSVVFAAPGFADCPATNEYSYSYTTAAVATLSYASSYSYTGTNGLGQNQNVTVSFTTNGTSGTTINGNQMPAITTLINDGGTTNRNLMIGGTLAGRTAAIAGATRVIVTTFTFATPIRDFTVQLNDIDYRREPIPGLEPSNRGKWCVGLYAFDHNAIYKQQRRWPAHRCQLNVYTRPIWCALQPNGLSGRRHIDKRQQRE